MENVMKPRKIALQLFDVLVINIINILMFFLTRNFIELPKFSVILYQGLIMIVILYIPRFVLGIYKFSWRYASHQEYLMFIVGDFLGTIIFLFIDYMIYFKVPYLIYHLSIFLLAMMISGLARMIYQLINQYQSHPNYNKKEKIQIAIIGAGLSGTLLAQTLKKSSTSKYYPYCFIDIDKAKIGGYINGIRVYDADKNIVELLKKMPVRELIIAINGLSPEKYKQLLQLYSSTSLPVRIFDYPQDGQEVDTRKQIRDIKIEDLLFRETISFEDDRVYDYYGDKVILVTGGGGSIGSELCRQIASLKPKKLIILDIYENNAYDIQQWLRNKYGYVIDLEIEIASVRDRHKIELIFQRYKPDIVFHAAAHKHVPLMEHCCDEAVKNNVFGTYNVINAAESVGVKKFIAISTDKAVNPTNIMGASKRLCEMMIRSKKDSKTDFIAVRFGNVLGSNGSVIPLFKNQIEKGGPITLTDKRIIRYFMTIPEAVQLVMQAGVNANKSDIFVLDMGEPVKILTLAENLIKLSGYKPYEDIDIVEIGLRPGEKLYEELLVAKDNLITTDNKKIFIEHKEIITTEDIEKKLEHLRIALVSCNNDLLKSAMMDVVPTFRTPDEINKAI
jgi:Predicted nucleoside-diphosphate sugar epimerases